MDSETTFRADPAAPHHRAPTGPPAAPGEASHRGRSPRAAGDTLVHSSPAGAPLGRENAPLGEFASTATSVLADGSGATSVIPDGSGAGSFGRTEILTSDAPGNASPALDAPAMPEIAEPAPVFVDLSGRRRRLGRRIGMVCGGFLIAFLVAMVIGVATGASVPGTPWTVVPGAQHHHKKTKAPSPLPKQAPHGQNRPDGRTPGSVPSGSSPAGRSGGGGRGGGGHGTSPSTTPKPSASAPTSSASPSPTATRTRPGNGKPTPPGQTRRPKATG
ncbi:hypothetical protein [Actinomadura rupiterrae]|uniref:hypothetical protein n=1 Tax=Actinomadura rupiterrae TaxID=559627 RepID=UPI0020A53C93|nr:hypothetical protein [Actinomadura rupiterrae]MCP2338047.1 hypothetical protein [Actinomadura rupiterrae]